ncbi:MAG: Teichoic acids export ATP-binding protein TagH [Deltaproteobacteria bacterium ADurb.Bin151]|nr:MAG: Teichoic acids export ATP-binding protein TagH [Deltaproteobacteria bacterium ADurb.Bin151]
MTILRIQNLGKAYKRYFSHWARLAEWCLPSSPPRHHVHWALQDVNCEVQHGEAIGIVGMNGAGKSTLLKIIAGTTQPTTGIIQMNGRVAALLELGMGFHPDFTGRQNVVMAGQLFGFLVDEIQTLLPEIEAFAEIGDYIEQPVRTYSSGMLMRLAFAVATAQRPDLLIVDEALSVGDSYFQHKSFRKIRTFREEGTTLLLVSHDRNAIQSICDRVIVLHEGKVVKEGPAEEAMDFYHALLAARDVNLIRQERNTFGKVQTVSGGGEITVAKVRLLTGDGKSVEAVETGTNVRLEITARVNKPVEEAVMGFMIKDRFGQIMYGINSYRLGQAIEHLSVGEQLVFCFEFVMNLGKGNYSITTAISKMDSHLSDNYEWCDGGLIFSVLNTRKVDFVGSVSLNAVLSFQRVSPES